MVRKSTWLNLINKMTPVVLIHIRDYINYIRE
jgi:hypothetical protein